MLMELCIFIILRSRTTTPNGHEIILPWSSLLYTQFVWSMLISKEDLYDHTPEEETVQL